MRMYSVHVALALHRVTEIYRSSTGGSADFLSYDFVTGTSFAYSTSRFAPVIPQYVDHGALVRVLAPAVDVVWDSTVVCKTISDAECDYRQYRGEFIGDDDLLGDV